MLMFVLMLNMWFVKTSHPITPKSDQFQIFPAASPEILHHSKKTVHFVSITLAHMYPFSIENRELYVGGAGVQGSLWFPSAGESVHGAVSAQELTSSAGGAKGAVGSTGKSLIGSAGADGEGAVELSCLWLSSVSSCAARRRSWSCCACSSALSLSCSCF